MKKIYILSSALAIAATLTACHGSHKSSDSDEEMPVDVAEATVDSVVLHKTYPGYLDALDQVEVVGRASGQLTGTYFKGGDHVSKGQVLFTIEDTKYRDAVTQAQAQLETAKSTNAYASSHYQAVKKAFESDAVSQMEVNQAESAFHESEAAIKNAQAALQTARTQLGYCTVTAPISGTITSGIPYGHDFINGEVSPVPLATIYDNSAFNAIFSIEDEQYINLLNEGHGPGKNIMSKVPLSFSEKLPHSYFGDLSYIAPSIDKSTGTMVVKCVVENPYDELRNGMYLTIDLPYSVNPKAILVKDSSIGTDQLGKYLYVVNDSDKVVYTTIKIGELVNDSMRVVIEGIDPGTRYVTKALLKVRDGMKVKPIKTN